MRTRGKRRSVISLVAVMIFVFSMAYAGTSAVLPTQPVFHNAPSQSVQYRMPGSTTANNQAQNGTYVNWNQDSGSYSDEWTWENKNWLFGPSPSFEMYHENGSLLTDDSYAEIDELIIVSITVPKNIFSENTTLGRVSMNGWFLTPDWNYSAGFDFAFENWEWTYEPWNHYSYQWNSSDDGGPPLPSFMDMEISSCQNHSDSNAFYFDFAVSFNSHAPLGLYSLHLSIEDSDHNWIDTYGYGQYEEHFLAVGMDPADAWTWSWGGSYTLQKLDMDGDTLYSVSRETDFLMRFNITQDPEYVALGFRMPWGMDKKVNVTGWYDKLVTTQGGWQYDETLDTYAWNESLEVSFYEWTYGKHEEYRWTELGNNEEVNVTVLRDYWDDDQGLWVTELVNETRWVDRKLYFVYNHTTGTFDTRYGYRYWGYPYDEYVPNTWNEEIVVIEEMPEDLPVFYELNESQCSAAKLGKDWVVDFVGHFTDLMPKTSQYSGFEFEPRVMGEDNQQFSPATWGENPRQTQLEYNIARRITIESPVTIAKLLNEDGTAPTGWMFQADKGENFMVKGRLQGGSSLASDIDGVQLNLNAWDGFWTEDESRWSEVTYEIQMDMSGVATLKAYNRTEKQNYTYSTYWDWVWTNTTGWHQVYNDTTGIWEMQYGEYYEWQWKELEGWHWQWWYYNQLTGKWQTKYIQHKSAETEVSPDFCEITQFHKWTTGGDLYVDFLVNMSQNVPDTDYWWDFNFMNYTWYVDYSSEYGEHEVLTWEREWVYSFEHESERVYVDPFKHDQLGFYNDTLCTNQGAEYLYGKERPYIIIDGEKLPIKVRENYDPWSGYTWETIFFYDHWDQASGKDVYFYELMNDTKVLVEYNETIWIYNVTTSTGDSFLTAMDYHWWWDHDGTSYVYWVDLEGNIHQGDYSTHAKWNLQSFTFHDKIAVSPWDQERFIRYGESNLLFIDNWWWVSSESTYYMTDTDGNLYELMYNDTSYYYMAYIDGAWQQVSWPERYYSVEYEGSDAMLVTWNTHKYWHTEIDGVDYEMPYPGANAEWHWQMDNTIGDGGAVPTTKSVVYQGNTYPVYNVSTTFYTDIGGTTYELDKYDSLTYSTANGTDIWQPTPAGYSADVGTFDNSLHFDKKETIIFDDNWDKWNSQEEFYYLYQPDNDTIWIVNDTMLSVVFEYDYEGKSLYSSQTYPYYEYSGNETWYEYKAINGTIYKMDSWEPLPALDQFMVENYYNGTDDVFEFMGETYLSSWEGQTIHVYKLFNSTASEPMYMLKNFHEVFQFTYDGTLVNATASQENVHRLRHRWGHATVYGLKPIESTVYKNFHNLVIGVPSWGMWGVKNWVINPDNGALDLDGDLETPDDQYYVLEEYSSKDSWTHEWDRMDVHVNWDPNGTLYGDEMNIHSWMGMDTFTWSYEWNQTFYWYHADDMTPLSATEIDDVIDTVLTEDEEPRPGYWDISWMAQNTTWADIIAEAEENGWWWIADNEQSWTWLSFGVGQDYGTSYVDTASSVEHWLDIGLNYEFSGLMIWEDKNDNDEMNVDLTDPGSGELSHYLIPDWADSVEFVTPGESYGDTSDSGNMRVELDDPVSWGVIFNDVNGTVYPFTLNGYWGWYDSVMTGSDFTDFENTPTEATIDELSFIVNFQGHVSEDPEALNNYAEIKVDNYVGNWVVYKSNGNPYPSTVLENKSLCLNYFSQVRMSDFAVKAGGEFADSESTVSSETFELETAGAQFAEMIMGGVTYDWSKNTTAPYNVTSQTTPVGTFRMAYQSESGQSATAWSFSSQMFIVSIGFPSWDGYSVFQDPVFVSYTSVSGTTDAPGAVNFGTFSMDPTVPQETDSVNIGVDIYSDQEIYSVELQYWTDSTSDSTSMTSDGGTYYTGTIPPYADATQVWYKVVVQTESGVYESQILSYIVGQGAVTTSPPPGGFNLPIELIALVGGAAVVIVIVALLLKRRR